jgi:hypothetical protein
VAESEKSLDEMTVAELRSRASELEITGRSSMNKEELIQSVKDAEEQTEMMETNGSNGDSASSDVSDEGEIDASGITAPSIGPHTTIEHVPPEERLDMDQISDVDAMGLDKRRQVGGKRYGASPAKQLAVYGGALAVIVALFIGAKLLTDELDKAPAEGEVEPAVWTQGEQKAPAPIDFPRSTEQ